MIRINLLPVREERRRQDAQQFLVLVLATFLAAILIASFFHWRVLGQIDELETQIAQTQRQIDQFGPQLEKVKRYREVKAEIEKKLGVIEELDESRSGPVRVMDELSTHAPERLWVTRVETEGRTIRIHGMSLDNELVALFMTALNGSPYFKDVELAETEAREKGGFKLNEFELSASITSPHLERRESEAALTQKTAATAGTTPTGTGR